jgi:hypothetical protein
MARKLNWSDEPDAYGNTEWCASGPYTEGFTWRLRQRISENKIEWFEAHDAELLSRKPESYSTIEEAKADVEEQHATILAEAS